MDSNKTYGPAKSDNLNDFSFPDMNETWPGMKDILDKEMPQEKRRGILFWFNSRISLFLLLFVSIVAAPLFYIGYHHNKDENKILTSKIAESSSGNKLEGPGWKYIQSIKLNPADDEPADVDPETITKNFWRKIGRASCRERV